MLFTTVCCLVPVVVGIAGRRAEAAPKKLTLDEIIAKTLTGPRVRMATEDRAAAAARVAEADAARLPRIKATAFGTISPEIDCLDELCNETTPKNFALRFAGLFGSAQLDVTQPIYTFGKIAHARAAARAGLDAHEALANEAAGDLAVDAARAYWGLKLARELGLMLDDGIDEIDKALAKLADSPDISVQDRQRIAVLLAEAKIQRAEAKQGELQALAGLRALTGIVEIDVDDVVLAPSDRTPPATAIGEQRPQSVAARAGSKAADELAEFASSYYWPDLAIVGSAVVSRAQGVDDPPSVFANDPFNRSGAGLVLALQWQIEPWTTRARVDRARAEAAKARAQSELATIGARFDAENALAEVTSAKARVDAATAGEKAARTWLAAILQQEAIGAAEPKDLADAYIAWFQMRARWAQAVMQLNVAVVRLDRAQGQFRARRGSSRAQ